MSKPDQCQLIFKQFFCSSLFKIKNTIIIKVTKQLPNHRSLKKFIFNLVGLFVSCNTPSANTDRLGLEAHLTGKWEADAFDGKLMETWHLEDGWMVQKGIYVEKEDTLYRATTKIENIGRELILISVIEDSSPKVFKAIEREPQKIVFENKDYKNPYRVVYEFISSKRYSRTIQGYEKDSLVRYQFNFVKQ